MTACLPELAAFFVCSISPVDTLKVRYNERRAKHQRDTYDDYGDEESAHLGSAVLQGTSLIAKHLELTPREIFITVRDCFWLARSAGVRS